MKSARETRRSFLRKAALGTVALGASRLGHTEKPPSRKPNIIYILADDLGYGDLGCYGQERIATPNIDRMAREGMRFTQHYAGSTVCAPSRCVLMTGLHTGHAKVRGNDGLFLGPEDFTVAQLLKDAGYTTGLVGKWGLGNEATTGIPGKQGFDYFFGYLNQTHAHNYYPSYLWRNEEQVPLPNIVKRPERGSPNSMKYGGVSSNKDVYSHDLFTEEALSYVDRNKDNPFFLYLAYTIPHTNNEAGKSGMEVPSLGRYADEDWPTPQKAHAAMITRLDRDVGKLLDKLGELGLDDDTLVIFTSDNGPHQEGGAIPDFFSSSGPLRGIKRDFYEGGIRVPMIARWPRAIAPGSESGHLSAFWDFLPTCADLAGTATPKGIDGISFLPTLLGKEQEEHAYLYWEFYERGGKQAVRWGDWKGIRLRTRRNPDNPIELYNLEDDLGEAKDVAAQNPRIARKIAKMMKAAHTDSATYSLDRRK